MMCVIFMWIYILLKKAITISLHLRACYDTTKCNDIPFVQVDISLMGSSVMIDFAFLHALFFLIVVKLSFFFSLMVYLFVTIGRTDPWLL